MSVTFSAQVRALGKIHTLDKAGSSNPRSHVSKDLNLDHGLEGLGKTGVRPQVELTTIRTKEGYSARIYQNEQDVFKADIEILPGLIQRLDVVADGMKNIPQKLQQPDCCAHLLQSEDGSERVLYVGSYGLAGGGPRSTREKFILGTLLASALYGLYSYFSKSEESSSSDDSSSDGSSSDDDSSDNNSLETIAESRLRRTDYAGSQDDDKPARTGLSIRSWAEANGIRLVQMTENRSKLFHGYEHGNKLIWSSIRKIKANDEDYRAIIKSALQKNERKVLILTGTHGDTRGRTAQERERFREHDFYSKTKKLYEGNERVEVRDIATNTKRWFIETLYSDEYGTIILDWCWSDANGVFNEFVRQPAGSTAAAASA